MKVGLIGEDPNDSAAIANLLKMKFNHQYIPVLKRKKGDQIESDRFTELLKMELKGQKLDVLIFIRDLDGFNHEEDKMSKRMAWFEKNSQYFNGDSLFFLNIQSLEAIFFADVKSLNAHYKIDIKHKNPIFINKPKSELKRLTAQKYHENKAAELISKLNYDAVLQNYEPLKEIHNYFTE
jgi:hypothetical protein